MKKFSLHHIVLFASFLFVATFVNAQSVTVTHKKTNEEGTTSYVKKRFDDPEAASSYVESLKNSEGADTDIKLEINANSETVTFMGNGENFNFNWEEMVEETNTRKVRQGRPFLGVNLNDNGEGILITRIVPNTGAEKAGLQDGDRLISLGGQKVETHQDLRVELSKYEAGDGVDIVYLRDGQPGQTEAVLTNRRSSSWDSDPCRVFIGVSLGGRGNTGTGIHVNHVIADTPAEAADMKGGDVITALDGITVNTFNELLVERNKHQPGDNFTLSILRDGTPMQINAQFKSCDGAEVEEEEEIEIVEEPVQVVEEESVEVVEVPEFEIDNTLEPEVFNVFPNPSYGKFNVQFQGAAVPTQLRILDVAGRVLYQENLNNFDGYYQNEVNLTGTTAETVFLQVVQGEKVVTKQLKIIPKV